MERTATQCITYGLYMLSTVWEKKANGCIIDTCMQISHEPVQIAIAVSNQSYTCELLKKSGIFAVSILDETCTFETIKHFGYQSGRDVDKMKTLELPVNEQGGDAWSDGDREDILWFPYVIYRNCDQIKDIE